MHSIVKSNNKYALTKKKEPKKEFSLKINDNSAFPSLNQLTTSGKLKPLLSFANATKKEVNKETKDLVGDIIPGWLYIRKQNGKIEYKYGKATDRYPCSDDNFEQRLGKIIFYSRISKEQYERDNDIIRLGDLSEFYGENTLYESFEEEERLLYSNVSETEYSSSSDAEYESYCDTYDNNKFEITAQ